MKNKKAWKIIANIAEWTALVLLGLFALNHIWNFVDSKHGSHHPFFGVKQTVIVTGSMSFVNSENAEELKDCKDQIQINDVIVTSNKITYDSLKVHDVILFRSNKGDICHRIIEKYITSDGKEMIVTRGDVNTITDDAIEFKDVIGKVVKIKSKAGKYYAFVQSPYFLLGGSLAIGFVTAGYLISELGKDKRKKAKKSSQTSDITKKTETSESDSKTVVLSNNNQVKQEETKIKEKQVEKTFSFQKDKRGRFTSTKKDDNTSDKKKPLKDSKGRFVSNKK